MAGYYTIALEDEQVLVFSSDAYYGAPFVHRSLQCFRRALMTNSNRFDLLTNAYKINKFVINILKNKCIDLDAPINLIYSQMHIKQMHWFKSTNRFDLLVNPYVTQSYLSSKAMYCEYHFFKIFGH